MSKRAPNFSSSEVNLLITLVKQNKAKIECKKSDAMSWKEKNDVWKKLAEKFNEISGKTYRDFKNLRGKYENLKKTAKKRFADEKNYSRGTGGGKAITSTITSVDSEIKEMLGPRIEGHPSIFDSDNISDLDQHSDAIPTNTTHEELSRREEERSSDWSSYTPSMLRKPPSSPLQTKHARISRYILDSPENTQHLDHDDNDVSIVDGEEDEERTNTKYISQPNNSATNDNFSRVTSNGNKQNSITRVLKGNKSVNRNRVTANKWSNIADLKGKLLILQIEGHRRELELKLKCIQEAHASSEKFKKEEHELKIALLKAQGSKLLKKRIARKPLQEFSVTEFIL